MIPDYDNAHYRSDDLLRPEVKVVETIDARSSSLDRVGTANVGMCNVGVPYLLNKPVSDFITNSINTMVGTDPLAERICPITVRIDSLIVNERKGSFSETGRVDCRLRFSFPVNADSISVTSVSAVSDAKSYIDVTSSLEDLLYKSVTACTKQFLADSYDPAPSHLLVDRADATSAADIDLRAGLSPNVGKSPYPSESDYLQAPATNPYQQMTFLYHYFTGEEMQDAYSQGFGFTYMGGESLGKKLYFGCEAGLLMASGTPVERPQSIWIVDSSTLISIYMPINISLMYPHPWAIGKIHSDRKGSFRPYAGVGGGVTIGFELMEAELSNFVSEVEVRNTVFRSAWTGEVVFGAEFGKWASNPFVEFRWVFSGPNKIAHGLSKEEEEQLNETLYNALLRPDGNMSGWQLCLGIRW